MSKGVMKIKPKMTIEEQHKDYSNEQLINAISNTLRFGADRLIELNEQLAVM